MRESPQQASGATPVVRTIPYADPLAVFAALRGDAMAVLLDSAGEGPDTGRYSVVACDPALTIRAEWQTAFDRLAQVLNDLPSLVMPPNWPIGPGLFGSFGYEL